MKPRAAVRDPRSGVRDSRSAIRRRRCPVSTGRSAVAAIAICLGAVASGACGKKGPPLAPLVRIPAAVELIQAARVGSDVYVTVTIPTANIDEHTPADISRVDVYAYTGRTAPARARWFELGTLVATVPVAPPPPESDEEAPAPSDAKTSNAPVQGARVTILDRLTADELVQGKLTQDPQSAIRDPQSAIRDPQSAIRDPESASRDRESASRDPQAVAREPQPSPREPEPQAPLKRFYTAVPFSPRGRPGPPGGVVEFPLLPVPDPPPSVGARYTQRAVLLSWEPSGGLIGFLLERPLPDDAPPIVEDEDGSQAVAPAVAGPLGYHVYREILPDVPAPRSADATDWREEPPVPLTPAPIPALEFTDNIEFDRRRCYTIRAVRGIGPDARVGEASRPVCLTPVDVFPPAPPQSLVTVASEGGISLAWEPNTELDLAGYVVLRGEATDDTLHPLTSAPLSEASYRDETVTPGVRYVYAVVAVDNRFPVPNVSGESQRVEETAR